MFYMFHYNKGGIPPGLIKFHDGFIKEIVRCFEKGKTVRRHAKEAQRAVKKALKIARKQKRKPGAMINRAISSIRGVSDEIEYTRKVLRTTYKNMEDALSEIESERVHEIIHLYENARESFEKKDFEKGASQLRESIQTLKKRRLVKTRTALFCGVSSEVGDLKRELQKRKDIRNMSGWVLKQS